MLTYVPTRPPIIPNKNKNTFFHNRQLSGPKPSLSVSATMVSMIAGNVNPRLARHTAPTSEMNGPKFGMAIAAITVAVTRQTRRMYSPRRDFGTLLIPGSEIDLLPSWVPCHIISTGTWN